MEFPALGATQAASSRPGLEAGEGTRGNEKDRAGYIHLLLARSLRSGRPAESTDELVDLKSFRNICNAQPELPSQGNAGQGCSARLSKRKTWEIGGGRCKYELTRRKGRSGHCRPDAALGQAWEGTHRLVHSGLEGWKGTRPGRSVAGTVGWISGVNN
jgi:hypothetical protein